MKRFEFPLQKVLEYETHIQKNEADVLRTMQAQYMGLSEKRDKILDEYEKIKHQYQIDCKKGLNVRKAAVTGVYITEQSQKIININLQMREQMNRIDLQRKCLVSVTQDKTMIQKLKDHSWEEYSAAQRKSEELSMEEFLISKVVLVSE